MLRNTCLAALLALLAGCAGVRPRLAYPENRSVTVALADAREPQATWARVQLRALGSFVSKWVLVDQDEQPQVTVRYHTFPDSADAVGEFTLGTNDVRIDLARTRSEGAFRAVLTHELVHWFINAHSDHPERALYHLCYFAFNEQAPPYCHPHIATQHAIMSPRVPDAPVLMPTHEDLAFFDWGMGAVGH